VFAATRQWAPILLATYILYFFALTTAGVVGPDEPRYASIGQEMARSGDWITPRLWGEPWFEKPPLLYWMTASASKLGAGVDLAPRLPVALASVLFLLFYFRVLRSEFGARPAAYASAILASSALWIGFSQVGVTDLPMTAVFSAAMLLGLRWLSTGNRRLLIAVGFLLGVAVLAKGLVPLALVLPLAWAGRKRWKEWLHPLPALVFLLTVTPWYVLCTMRHGQAFLAEFFGRHHFARFTSGVLLHEQPFWFYLPVLLAGLYPWTPLLAPLFHKRTYRDEGRTFLLLWAGFGFLFFSASAGKLPGYLLPLFPALAAMAGLALHEMRRAHVVLAGCCLLLPLTPVISGTFPHAFAEGLSRTTITGWNWFFAAACLLAAIAVWRLEAAGRRGGAVSVLAALVTLSVLYLKVDALPVLDRLASSRTMWRRVAADASQVCVDDIHRNWRYSLNYYSVTSLPECSQAPRRLRIRQTADSPPVVE
jgi:4-amino-4-deoxy-L-arabinose transferase-like glycosyltransferase